MPWLATLCWDAAVGLYLWVSSRCRALEAGGQAVRLRPRPPVLTNTLTCPQLAHIRCTHLLPCACDVCRPALRILHDSGAPRRLVVPLVRVGAETP